MGFSRQEYWTYLPFPPPGDLPNPGIKPASLASPALAGGFFITEPPGKPSPWFTYFQNVHAGSVFFSFHSASQSCRHQATKPREEMGAHFRSAEDGSERKLKD